MGSIDALVNFFGGTSRSGSTKQWLPKTQRPAEVSWRSAIHFQWTTPTFRHELTVAPEQVTATSAGEMQEFVTRALCHWLIDHFPFRAYEELLSTLIDMRGYYAELDAPSPPQLTAPKPLKLLTRTVRPEIEITEE